MDTLDAAFGAIQATVAAQARELEASRARESSLQDELSSLRASAESREAALLAANARLLAHVEELSSAAARGRWQLGE